MSPIALIVLCVFVVFGSATQRITGMGFALVASPVLVLVIGVYNGIPLIQVLNLAVSALVLSQVFRDVEVDKAVMLAIFGIIGVFPGAWMARSLSPAWLQIVIGTMVIIALLAMIANERARVFKGRAGAASAGFLSGFMNVTAGIGGPAIVLYSLSIGWRHAAFVATSQAYSIALNLTSLGVQGFPDLPLWMLALTLGCLVVGLIIGNVLTKKVSVESARKLVIVVALGGSVATVVKGVLALV